MLATSSSLKMQSGNNKSNFKPLAMRAENAPSSSNAFQKPKKSEGEFALQKVIYFFNKVSWAVRPTYNRKGTLP
jgi:hypothetical protein